MPLLVDLSPLLDKLALEILVEVLAEYERYSVIRIRLTRVQVPKSLQIPLWKIPVALEIQTQLRVIE